MAKKKGKKVLEDSLSMASTAAKTAKGKRRSKKAKRTAFAVFAVVLVLCILGGMYYFDIAPMDFRLWDLPKEKDFKEEVVIADGTLKVHFIDVGQGDAIFIQFPDGKTMLIDGGDTDKDVAQDLLDYLDDLNVETIDYVMLTHTDADHCGSLDQVISSDIDVKIVYMPKIKSTYENDPLKNESKLDNGKDITVKETVAYKQFVQSVVEEGSQIRYSYEGDSIEGKDGLYSFDFYNPNDELYSKISSAQDKNNVSPICILTFNGIKICFTGDADKAAEENFLRYTEENDVDTDVDVLKVAHHGGKESTNQPFLDAVLPEYAVISVGIPNSYGHPTAETLTRLSNMDCRVFRTDLNGDILLTVEDTALNWTFEKNAPSDLSLPKRPNAFAFHAYAA